MVVIGDGNSFAIVCVFHGIYNDLNKVKFDCSQGMLLAGFSAWTTDDLQYI